VFLVRKYRNIHVVPDGLFVTSHVVETGDRDELGFHSTATKVHLDMTATIQAPHNTDDTSRYTYEFFVRDAAHANRTVIASTAPRQIQFAATLASERRRIRQLAHENSTRTTFVVSAVRTLHHARLWNTRTPHMYQVDVVIYKNVKDEDGGTTRIPVDHVTTRHGIRTLHFDAHHGFHLNSQQFKLRGFCDHDTFAVVGMAIPDRINLFRAQASRSIGANSRRTSHNPPDPALLDIYDRLGMLVMDENRLFANKTEYVDNMGDLVMRDRVSAAKIHEFGRWVVSH
jgi:beta-galactosidase/beta-glucuronidase